MTATALVEPKASPARDRSRAERVAEHLTGWVDRLPVGLRRLLPRELVGFAILGSFTFTVDMTILQLLYATTSLPKWLVISLGYVSAFSLNFVLNRRLNFKSHAPVGPQAFRYGSVVIADYGITLGVTSLLSSPWVGLHIFWSRLAAGAMVAIMTYTLCRWWVFRETAARRSR